MPGDEPWSQVKGQKIVSAEHVSRPKQGLITGPADHHGVKVTTATGGSYLIHSGPNDGVVATPAANMSRQWQKGHDIPVNSNMTVNDALKAAGGRTNSELTQYVTSGTCIGAADSVESALRGPVRHQPMMAVGPGGFPVVPYARGDEVGVSVSCNIM